MKPPLQSRFATTAGKTGMANVPADCRSAPDPQTVMRLVGSELNALSLPERLKWGRATRSIQLTANPPSQRAENDPYLLILLATQELGEGREEQAKYLVEVAYEAFDRSIIPT